ncbi:DUF2125 domain-containing protein [Aquicoccus sp. G2-2]|uniref:DUF2125 domain-containing protein n=1 Tax=Aquicoccus sp. G2-2 TaxID=3092120 RepID=UPI002ADFE750|nr:DUF2125 domain-containing protein [Aquicoccus sp. G2-2]MEA1114429.1 DUF2125 domain-containing protein [Aquicoccus sp. G2-2]
MTELRKIGGIAALVTLMTGSAALADVTGPQIWSDWKNYFESFGYTISADEEKSGDTLTLNDLKMTMALPDGGGMVAVAMSGITFANNADGTVSITIPGTMPMNVHVAPEDDLPMDVTLDYSNTGLTTVVSGNPDDMTYTYSAATLGIALKEILVSGEPVKLGVIEMMLKDLRGNSHMTTGNLRKVEQAMSAGAVTYNVDITDPEKATETVKINGGLNGLSFEGDGSYPTDGFDPENMAAMMKAGFAFAGKFGYEGGATDFNIVADGETVQGKSSSASGTIDVALAEAGLRYIVSTTGVVLNVSGGDLPMPIDLKFGEAGFKLVTPVSKSDDSQDFALGLTLKDFEMSEIMWGMADPQGALPHDPATVALDLSGKGKLAFDIMDPEQQKAMERGEMGMPGALDSLDINDLEATVAGASLTGTGGFTFDFPKVMQTQGMQGVDGSISLKLEGANALADTLVKMGLLPEDKVMGARMMLSMFAVPAGDDVLTSKIEVKPDGQILANGQRLK